MKRSILILFLIIAGCAEYHAKDTVYVVKDNQIQPAVGE